MVVTETITTPLELCPLQPALSNDGPATSLHRQQFTSSAVSVPRRVFEAPPSAALTTTSRFAITALLVFANLVQFVSNFVTFAAGSSISHQLGHKGGPGQANWMAASYSLTQGAFVLITGRLGAIYGHKRLALVGCALFSLFSMANGFTKTYTSFIVTRALTGVGGGVFMPNAVAIITTTVPPGKLRNFFMGFFAASPPLGGMLGAFLAGVFIKWARWSYLFFLIRCSSLIKGRISAGSSALALAWLWYLLPTDQPVDKQGKLDLVGAFLGLGSLLLFNFAWNQAPSVGWQTTSEISCLVVSVLLFCAFLVWESSFAAEPIMPLTIFRAPTFTALIFVVLLGYMGFGIAIWYSIAWQEQLRHESILEIACHFVTFGLGSIIAVFFAAWLIPRLAAQYIIAVGVGVVIVGSILLATMPVQQSYWAQAFPALLVLSFCPDFVYVAAQVIASNSVNRKQQGVASSLVGTLNLYGISLGLGFAGTIESELNKTDPNPSKGYRAALIFGAGLATAGLLLDFVFVRMPKDEREGWDDSIEENRFEPAAIATAVERQRQSTV